MQTSSVGRLTVADALAPLGYKARVPDGVGLNARAAVVDGTKTQPALDVSVGLSPEFMSLDQRLPPFLPNTGRRAPHTKSGWPLGERAFFDAFYSMHAEDAHLGCTVDATMERETLTLRASGQLAGASETGAKRVIEALEENMEAVARRVLAEVLAEDLYDNGTSRQERRIAGMDRDHTGYRPLDEWAAQNKLAVTYDTNKWLASVVLKGRTLQLALACDRARIDGKEIDLGQFIVCKRGRWMVPGSTLSHRLGP